MNKSEYRNHVLNKFSDYLKVDIFNLTQPLVYLDESIIDENIYIEENTINFELSYLDDYLLDENELTLTKEEVYEIINEYMNNLTHFDKRNYLGRLLMDDCDIEDLKYYIHERDGVIVITLSASRVLENY